MAAGIGTSAAATAVPPAGEERVWPCSAQAPPCCCRLTTTTAFPFLRLAQQVVAPRCEGARQSLVSVAH